jgi:GTP-binding protein
MVQKQPIEMQPPFALQENLSRAQGVNTAYDAAAQSPEERQGEIKEDKLADKHAVKDALQDLETQAAYKKLWGTPCVFRLSVNSLEQLPIEGQGVEIAFVGRSNVGKSSLLNALVRRRGLARVSVTPGRTQMLNFFDLGDLVTLVDLPGSGYAEAPKALVATWNGLIRAYLRGRVALKRVVLLVDARHGVKTNDTEMMQLLDRAAVPYRVVLTKADKILPKMHPALMSETTAKLRKHPAAMPQVLLTSSETNFGIDALRQDLFALYTQHCSL